MRRLARLLRHDQRAATAVEYGLIISLIVLAMLAALQALAGKVIGMWNNVAVNVLAS